jgi:hypothetical protein
LVIISEANGKISECAQTASRFARVHLVAQLFEDTLYTLSVRPQPEDLLGHCNLINILFTLPFQCEDT